MRIVRQLIAAEDHEDLIVNEKDHTLKDAFARDLKKLHEMVFHKTMMLKFAR